MEEQFRYQHYRCVVPDIEPSVTELKEGEIAINLYAGKEKLFIKNTNNEIVRFLTENQVNTIVSAITEEIDELQTSAITNANNISTLDVNKIGDARYDSNTKRINFYNSISSSQIVSYIDASEFVKDGMVSNVEIIGNNLVITFNADSGKEPINIPLADIFDPSKYYTKDEIDNNFKYLDFGFY